MPVSTADLVSPAVACLRVRILAPPGGRETEELQALVAKVINAFLQSRWEWPRQFEQMTPFAFVLTDPRAERMDRRGLKALAGELQLKLFGSDGEGEVSLLLFEGSDMEVHRFAHLSVEDVDRVIAGEALNPPLSGALDRIRPQARPEAEGDHEGLPVAEAEDDLAFEDDPPARPSPSRSQGKLEAVYAGLYLSLTHSFIGSQALCRRARRDLQPYPDLASPEPLRALSAEEFDAGCVDSAVAALQAEGPGLMFIPLSFSSLVRPTGRRTYARFLCHLPIDQHGRLGAAVYDTPRAPSFSALSTIRGFLDPFFAEINLQVRDPAFEVEKLPPDIVSSVTLALPFDREPAERLAAIRRFMQKRDVYKKKRIWPGVGPVTTRAELEACVALRVPVISGPAVTPLAQRPVGARGVELESLPFKP